MKVLLAPTIVAHGKGRHSLNHVLGIISNSIITIALIGSVVLLVRRLPSKAEPPLRLLESGAALWITNVIVFALWYWRMDGGGPTKREKRHEFGSHSFLFPQMQIERSERGRCGVSEHWYPRFIDYLFIALTQSSTFGPTDAAIAGPVGKAPGIGTDSSVIVHCPTSDLSRSWRAIAITSSDRRSLFQIRRSSCSLG
jgi:hypothetical protein